ncbi:MAG: hypothetical protein KDK91_32925 [Gammaproteobacteria bacterium]|nr:hypothetical protein [Gammaproteobacteria bacterium]
MLPELSEAAAEGDIARIYAEIRHTCAVPYVSSLQRHLATRPGWLEWVWACVGPVFRSGEGPSRAWAAAQSLDLHPMPRISGDALALLDVDDAALADIKNVLNSFIRVSPTNLICSGLVRRFILGERPHGPGFAHLPAWEPPPSTLPLPGLVDMQSISTHERAVLMQLANEVAGQPFVPGLYRMLANWPGYLAHIATELGPRFTDAHTVNACLTLLERIEAVVDDLITQMPAFPEQPPMPPASQFDEVLSAIDSYRKTSPEMVVFCRLMREALPDPDA